MGSTSGIYIVSAACAEIIADVFMCPFEMIKVQMQTNSTSSPQTIRMALKDLLQRGSHHGHPLPVELTPCPPGETERG